MVIKILMEDIFHYRIILRIHGRMEIDNLSI